MVARCTNERHSRWADYGGRGIRVCRRWLTFENFLADMGERPEGLTLDRFPHRDGNYEPGNCRWASDLEQASNKRPHGNTVFVEAFGQRASVSEWARRVGIGRATLNNRIAAGWDAIDALYMPSRKGPRDVRRHAA